MAMQKSIMDTKPELKWLPLAALYIPIKYQRALEGSASLKNIEHIQKRFNWAEHGTILVCKDKIGSERYAVIDGQHRVRAAELRDDVTELPCVIITPREVKEQAQAFLNINSRRTPLNMLQYHRAALVAGDETAIELERICAEAEVVIPHYLVMSTQLPPDTLQAIGFVRKMIRSGRFESQSIIEALKVLRAAHPRKVGILSYNIVRAVSEWVEHAPEVKFNDRVKTLRSLDVDSFDLEARKLRIQGFNASLWKGYLHLILERYEELKRKAA